MLRKVSFDVAAEQSIAPLRFENRRDRSYSAPFTDTSSLLKRGGKGFRHVSSNGTFDIDILIMIYSAIYLGIVFVCYVLLKQYIDNLIFGNNLLAFYELEVLNCITMII